VTTNASLALGHRLNVASVTQACHALTRLAPIPASASRATLSSRMCRMNFAEVLLACSYTCDTCVTKESNCLTCNLVALREKVGNACPCKDGYYDDTTNSVKCQCSYHLLIGSVPIVMSHLRLQQGRLEMPGLHTRLGSVLRARSVHLHVLPRLLLNRPVQVQAYEIL
jgi:hypothetical protein